MRFTEWILLASILHCTIYLASANPAQKKKVTTKELVADAPENKEVAVDEPENKEVAVDEPANKEVVVDEPDNKEEKVDGPATSKIVIHEPENKKVDESADNEDTRAEAEGDAIPNQGSYHQFSPVPLLTYPPLLMALNKMDDEKMTELKKLLVEYVERLGEITGIDVLPYVKAIADMDQTTRFVVDALVPEEAEKKRKMKMMRKMKKMRRM